MCLLTSDKSFAFWIALLAREVVPDTFSFATFFANLLLFYHYLSEKNKLILAPIKTPPWNFFVAQDFGFAITPNPVRIS